MANQQQKEEQNISVSPASKVIIVWQIHSNTVVIYFPDKTAIAFIFWNNNIWIVPKYIFPISSFHKS